jgi:hypothetical protein
LAYMEGDSKNKKKPGSDMLADYTMRVTQKKK